MKVSENSHCMRQKSSTPGTPQSTSHGSWKEMPWLPNKTEVKKLVAWPMAALVPSLLSPVKAQVTNCQDASAASRMSITVQRASSVIANITAGCSGTCMGASIAQLPDLLCFTSRCVNSTTSYRAEYEALFTQADNNSTFFDCMHGVTDGSVQPVANALDRHNTVLVIVNCLAAFGGAFFVMGMAVFIEFCLLRRNREPEALELPRLSDLKPEQVTGPDRPEGVVPGSPKPPAHATIALNSSDRHLSMI